MNTNLFLFFAFLIGLSAFAQNKSLGVGTASPNPNAALHVESPTNNQGFIMPRLTTIQRTGMGALLTATENGLMLYDTDLKTIFIWDGTVWKTTAEVAGGAKLSYPYKDSVTTTLTGNDVFALKYNNAANKRVLRVESLSPTNGSSAVSVQQNGTGLGLFSRIDNPASGTTAVFGTTNSNLGGAVAPVGVYGESTGTGSLGAAFRINNPANTFPAMYAETNGTGPAARVNAVNVSSAAPALEVVNAGTGNAIQTTGRIQAGQFIGNGSGLTNVGLGLPFASVNTTAPNRSNLLDLTYSGTDTVGVALFRSTNANNAFSLLFLQSEGGRILFGSTNAPNSPGAEFRTNNTANTQPALRAQTLGTGNAANFLINNAASNQAAVRAATNGTGAAVNGANTGPGNGFAGLFNNTQATNAFPAIQANTVGTGPGVRVLQNATSQGSGIDVILQNATGTAQGLFVNQQGLGVAGNFTISNSASSANALQVSSNGNGSAGNFLKSGGTTGAAVFGKSTVPGQAGYFEKTDGSGGGSAVEALQFGTGDGAAAFGVLNAASPSNTIFAQTTGTGAVAYLTHNGASGNIIEFNNNFTPVARVEKSGRIVANSFQGDGSLLTNLPTGGLTLPFSSTAGASSTLFEITSNGTARAGAFTVNNAVNSVPALTAVTNGTGPALFAESTSGNTVLSLNNSTGDGFAGNFQNSQASNTFPAIQASTRGLAPGVRVIQNNTSLGSGMDVFLQNTASTATGFAVNNAGLGSTAVFNATNASNSGPALFASTIGTGAGIRSESSGFAAVDGFHNGVLGNGGYFGVNNPTNNRAGLYGYTLGVGAATMGETATGFAGVFGLQTGTSGRGGLFSVDNPANSNDALYASNSGIGGAIRGEILNAASNNAAILGYTNGTGLAAYFNHTGASGSVAAFASNSTNVARIDKTGRGFFNNGTQTGGADVAEMFEVEGARDNYEPGDVLVISESTDRTVEKSSSRMSTKVVGVFATKPGVTLTERGIDADLSDMVPMGVIGVIPTKVCNENGPIKRGDLLVTSSKTGHAMKAISEKGDCVFPSGAVIGKALENFEAGETGLIKVLVNVK